MSNEKDKPKKLPPFPKVLLDITTGQDFEIKGPEVNVFRDAIDRGFPMDIFRVPPHLHGRKEEEDDHAS